MWGMNHTSSASRVKVSSPRVSKFDAPAGMRKLLMSTMVDGAIVINRRLADSFARVKPTRVWSVVFLPLGV
jgi:hypothetical protein